MLHGNMQANFYKTWKIQRACIENFCKTSKQFEKCLKHIHALGKKFQQFTEFLKMLGSKKLRDPIDATARNLKNFFKRFLFILKHTVLYQIINPREKSIQSNFTYVTSKFFKIFQARIFAIIAATFMFFTCFIEDCSCFRLEPSQHLGGTCGQRIAIEVFAEKRVSVH